MRAYIKSIVALVCFIGLATSGQTLAAGPIDFTQLIASNMPIFSKPTRKPLLNTSNTPPHDATPTPTSTTSTSASISRRSDDVNVHDDNVVDVDVDDIDIDVDVIHDIVDYFF